MDLPTALGWLYVAEGSNLGAAFLLKWAAALGLNETHGARHLAASPEGRARHWRSFTEALDGIELTQAEEGRVADGAREAFVPGAWTCPRRLRLRVIVLSGGGR